MEQADLLHGLARHVIPLALVPDYTGDAAGPAGGNAASRRRRHAGVLEPAASHDRGSYDTAVRDSPA